MTSTTHRTISPLRDFLRTESAGGIVLVAMTGMALLWANSPWRASYTTVWDTEFSLSLGRYVLALDLGHWVNDALMTLFFFVVGLEIKRESTSGHLATRETLTLPLAAAVGGMVIPAMLYLVIAGGTAPQGWGVPMATDIALAVGLLSTLGSSVPRSARAFLLGLAVVDDIGAIVVIAVFYSDGASLSWLALAAVMVTASVVLKKTGVQLIVLYLAVGVGMWFALKQAGVHPTIAGVTMGLLTPTTAKRNSGAVDVEEETDDPSTSVSLVEWFEHLLHPWSSFVILPLFALANAGIELSTDAFSDALSSPIAWGIFVGLVVGKPVGVLAASLFAKAIGIAKLPTGATAWSLLTTGHAAGIGFTVSLFISELAFDDPSQQSVAKLAILLASIISALLAIVVAKNRSTTTENPVAAAE